MAVNFSLASIAFGFNDMPASSIRCNSVFVGCEFTLDWNSSSRNRGLFRVDFERKREEPAF